MNGRLDSAWGNTLTITLALAVGVEETVTVIGEHLIERPRRVGGNIEAEELATPRTPATTLRSVRSRASSSASIKWGNTPLSATVRPSEHNVSVDGLQRDDALAQSGAQCARARSHQEFQVMTGMYDADSAAPVAIITPSRKRNKPVQRCSVDLRGNRLPQGLSGQTEQLEKPTIPSRLGRAIAARCSNRHSLQSRRQVDNPNGQEFSTREIQFSIAEDRPIGNTAVRFDHHITDP